MKLSIQKFLYRLNYKNLILLLIFIILVFLCYGNYRLQLQEGMLDKTKKKFFLEKYDDAQVEAIANQTLSEDYENISSNAEILNNKIQEQEDTFTNLLKEGMTHSELGNPNQDTNRTIHAIDAVAEGLRERQKEEMF